MRKLVYHVAATLDNYISHEDGSIDGFPDGDHVQDYLESLKSYDTVVMGRATYEFGYRFGMKPGAAPYPNMRNYVFSKTLTFQQGHEDGLHIVRDDPSGFIANLKQQAGTSIYLCGGGKLAGYLFDRGQIDQLIIKLNPLILGKGIPLFGGSTFRSSLSLLDTKAYSSGVVLLKYDINKLP